MLYELIDELIAIYPEQEDLLEEMYADVEVLDLEVAKKRNVALGIWCVDDILNLLWDRVDNENLDDRNLTDKEFAIVITDIKDKVANLESVIADYRAELIAKFNLPI